MCRLSENLSRLWVITGQTGFESAIVYTAGQGAAGYIQGVRLCAIQCLFPCAQRSGMMTGKGNRNPVKTVAGVTHAHIWRLAGPMILSNLSVPVLGAVDTAVVGHLGEPYYIGAVAVGALIFDFVFWGFGFLRMGTTGLTAQAHGAGDALELRAIVYRALWLAGVIALVVVLAQGLIAWVSFSLLQTSSAVEHYARQYFALRIWAAPAALGNYVLIGWFLGRQNARLPLLITVLINVLNGVLDVWFVFGLGWGVPGVAMASVMAEYVGLLLGVWLVWRVLGEMAGGHAAARVGLARVLAPGPLRRLVAVNRDLFIRTVCLIGGFAFFTAQGARQGDVILAANAVLLNFQTFMAYGLDGFAHAAEALTGRVIGERSRSALRQVVFRCGQWMLGMAILLALGYALAGRYIIAAMTDVVAVREAALAYLPWLILTPLVSCWAYLFDGVFIGATRSREMRNTMLLSTALYLALWYSMGVQYGNQGLWATLLGFMALRGLSMAFVYVRQRGDWIGSAHAVGRVGVDEARKCD